MDKISRLLTERNASYGGSFYQTDRAISAMIDGDTRNLQGLLDAGILANWVIIMSKMNRAVYSPKKGDHYHDIQGYSKLIERILADDNLTVDGFAGESNPDGGYPIGSDIAEKIRKMNQDLLYLDKNNPDNDDQDFESSLDTLREWIADGSNPDKINPDGAGQNCFGIDIELDEDWLIGTETIEKLWKMGKINPDKTTPEFPFPIIATREEKDDQLPIFWFVFSFILALGILWGVWQLSSTIAAALISG